MSNKKKKREVVFKKNISKKVARITKTFLESAITSFKKMRGGSHANRGGSSSTFITGTDITENDALLPFVPRGGVRLEPRGGPPPSRLSEPQSSWQLSVDVNNRPSLVLGNTADSLDEMEQLRKMVARTRKKLDNRMSEMKTWRKDIDSMRKEFRKVGSMTGNEALIVDSEDEDEHGRGDHGGREDKRLSRDADRDRQERLEGGGGSGSSTSSSSSSGLLQLGGGSNKHPLALTNQESTLTSTSSASTSKLLGAGVVGKMRRGSGRLPPLGETPTSTRSSSSAKEMNNYSTNSTNLHAPSSQFALLQARADAAGAGGAAPSSRRSSFSSSHSSKRNSAPSVPRFLR
ncbi:unnamed protein product [Amoebophrya sp. A25]|nr:unnamed protein product [Amoebophrya sp. A25]|eukprot:GSA25T00001421001.1